MENLGDKTRPERIEKCFNKKYGKNRRGKLNRRYITKWEEEKLNRDIINEINNYLDNRGIAERQLTKVA